jgi:hypothetical protein
MLRERSGRIGWKRKGIPIHWAEFANPSLSARPCFLSSKPKPSPKPKPASTAERLFRSPTRTSNSTKKSPRFFRARNIPSQRPPFVPTVAASVGSPFATFGTSTKERAPSRGKTLCRSILLINPTSFTVKTHFGRMLGILWNTAAILISAGRFSSSSTNYSKRFRTFRSSI